MFIKNLILLLKLQMKTNAKFLKIMIGLLSLIVTNLIFSKDVFETWTEHLDCGETHYKLESICKSSQSDNELNDCKSQTLTIASGEKIRKVSLPELNKQQTRIYEEVGGNIKEFFVIYWGCTKIGNINLVDIYYSIGGGSAPYSEAFAVYKNGGKLLKDNEDPRQPKRWSEIQKILKPVHSIKPDFLEK